MKHKLFKAWEDSSRVAWILIRQTPKYLERYKFIPNEITTVQLIIAATLIHHSIYIQLTYSISVTTYNSSWITFWTSSLVPTMLDMLKSLCRLQKEGTCFERLMSPIGNGFHWVEGIFSFFSPKLLSCKLCPMHCPINELQISWRVLTSS